MRKKQPVICPYCQKRAQLVPDATVYGKSYGGMVYLCRPCKAWVGVHKGGVTPLGRLANAELRKLKMRGHELFDPIWRAAWRIRGGSKNFHRNAAYRWLADSIGIPTAECHFGMMGPEQARKAIEFLEAFYTTIQQRKGNLHHENRPHHD